MRDHHPAVVLRINSMCKLKADLWLRSSNVSIIMCARQDYHLCVTSGALWNIVLLGLHKLTKRLQINKKHLKKLKLYTGVFDSFHIGP